MSSVMELKLSDIMNPRVQAIALDTKLEDAARIMAEAHISCLVIEVEQRAVGILTERDLVRLLLAHCSWQTEVVEVMSAPVFTLPPNTPFTDGLAALAEHGVRHLVVANADQVTLGIVSETDFRTHLGRDVLNRIHHLASALDRRSPSLPPDTPLAIALERMVSERWDYVVVTSRRQPVGILTERDIPHLMSRHADCDHLTLQEVMHAPVLTVPLTATVIDAVALMEAHRIRHIVVVDDQEQYIGSVSQHGLLERLGVELTADGWRAHYLVNAQKSVLENLLRHILDATYEGILVTAEDGVIIEVNQRLLDMWCIAQPPKIGDPSAALLEAMCPLLLEPGVCGALLARISTDNQDIKGMLLSLADGRTFEFNSRLMQLEGRSARMWAFHDISLLRQMETALQERESIYSGIVDQAADGILLIDSKTLRLLEFNDAACSSLGYTREEFSTLTLLDLQGTSTPERVRERVAGILDKGQAVSEVLHRRRDGSLRHTRVSSKAIQLQGKRYLAAIWYDITEQKRNEEKLRLAASVFQEAGEGILITDSEARILDANRMFSVITGYAREEVNGRNPSILQSGLQGEPFYRALWAELLEKDYWHGEIVDHRKNGEQFVEEISIIAVRNDAGQVSHYIGIFADITEKKQQQERIERLAYYDPLTGLANRVVLADRMAQALTRADRNQQRVAICYMDLDGFKPVNDRYGHKAGDRVLVEIARRLQETIRANDTVARLGGDEFVLLLTDLDSSAEGEQILARVLEQVAQPCDVAPDASVSVSASLGVAYYPDHENDPDILLRHADQAMYQAKQHGRSCIHVFDPDSHEHVRQQRKLRDHAKQALTEHEFVLWWQPKVNILENRVVGVEGLLRWPHPDGRVTLPNQFLPSLEHDDLIVRIGEFVLDQALSALSRWRVSGLDLAISLNIPPRQLLQPDFPRKLALALERHVTPPHRVELEVLETAALGDLERVARIMDECRRLGVGFALDDFGTGYSSMTYFRRLPVETVKIDQSFVRDMLADHEDRAIVAGILGLTTAFDKQAIAEGAETAEHLAVLREMGCTLVQGYAIAQPMPEAELLEWLQQFNPNGWHDGSEENWSI